MDSCCVFDKVYLSLIRYLNVNSIKPYLKQKQLLTDDELERLDFACKESSQSGAETLIKLVKRKGPGHEDDFLSALKDSMKFDPHQGHASIIAAMEAAEEDVVEKDFPMPTVNASIDSLEAVDREKKAATRCRVVKANSEIKIKFTKLVLDVYRLLSKKKVAVEEIRLSLLYLGCFKQSRKKAKYAVISPSSDLSHAESIQSLIECLHGYSSWYNYHLIKFVATEFGGEEGARIIDNYVRDLSTFCEKIIAFQCPEFSLSDGLPHGYDQLVVKVDWDHLSKTTQDIAIFQAELSSLLNLEPEVFILKTVEEGCILLTWAVPQSITTHIVMEAISKQQQLAKWNVLSVNTAGKHIDIKPAEKQPILTLQPPLQLKISTDSIQPQSPLSDYYDTSNMTADELEIVSTYSGRSRNSLYSAVSQVSSSGTIGLVTAKQFHSECDILSLHPLDIRLAHSLNTLSKNPSRMKQRAKTLLKFMLPKKLALKVEVASNQSVAACLHSKSINDCENSPQQDPAHGSSNFKRLASPDFPILDLSEEPAMKREGERVFSHYYFDNSDSKKVDISTPTDMSEHPLFTSSPLAEHKLGVIDEVPDHNLAVAPVDGLQKCSNNTAAGIYCSKSDVESGLGSQNLTSTTYNPCHTSMPVQRSESMKYQCFVPNNNLGKSGRLSLRKLPQNVNPSLYARHQESRERVDTPSSGYGESQSGCCSMQSSLYSLSSNLPVVDGASPDFPYHHEGFPSYYHSYSLKRNSVTLSERSKAPKKSARSHSFNGNFTVHHE